MADQSTFPIRKSHRLPSYDYATPGFYFVTLCTQDRLALFGTVDASIMHRSPAGDLIAACWEQVQDHYPRVIVDTLMVMPDHVHALLYLPGDSPTLSEVVHQVKSRTTAQYALGVRHHGWPPFHRRLWQQGYYDRVIRDGKELQRVSEYILQNPLRWILKYGAD